MITLTNGLPQGPNGLVVPSGSISFSLNVDATVIAAPYGFVSAAIPIVFQFDSTGKLVQPAQLYSNLELNPQNGIGLGTYYLVTFYDQNGARINLVPMWWQFPEAANSTVDIGEVTPYATVGGNVIFYPTNFALQPPSPTGLGGLFSNAGVTSEWVRSINTDGTVTLSQPAFTDISGSIGAGQLPASFGATTFSGLITAQVNVSLGQVAVTAAALTFVGFTSGSALITGPSTAGTVTNPFIFSNAISLPSGTFVSFNSDTAISRTAAGTLAVGTGTAGSQAGTIQAVAAQIGIAGTTSGILSLEGSTSGAATLTAPATAGTATNPIAVSNSLNLVSGTVYGWNADTGLSRVAAGVIGVGTGAAASVAGSIQAAVFAGPQQDKVTVLSGSSDAIVVPGTNVITTAGVDACTLALPVAGAFGTGGDGKILRIVSTTANAHTITVATTGHFILGGTSGTAYHVATFTDAVAGDYLLLLAYNGYWYVIGYSAGTTWS